MWSKSSLSSLLYYRNISPLRILLLLIVAFTFGFYSAFFIISFLNNCNINNINDVFKYNYKSKSNFNNKYFQQIQTTEFSPFLFLSKGINQMYNLNYPKSSPSLIVIIFTAAKNIDRRNAIRDTWLKYATAKYDNFDSNNFDDQRLPLLRRRIRHYFIIGTYHEYHSDMNVDIDVDSVDAKDNINMIDQQEMLNSEQLQHKDLLLLPSLKDGYHRLTAKLLESLKWISRLQSFNDDDDFDYLLKVDDDSFVRLDVLYDELVEKAKKSEKKDQLLLYWGYFDGRAHVKRSGQWKESDWFLCDR